jgi:hypothetical protein
MRRIVVLFFWVLFGAMLSPALALRCNSDLVEEGDTKFELVKKCGEPTYSEFVGYKLNNLGRREMAIELMIYGPWAGTYYQIEIVGGKINKIESYRDM